MCQVYEAQQKSQGCEAEKLLPGILSTAAPDECVVVDGDEERGDELAVHPVSHPAVARNNRVEVLDAVRALYRARPVPPERRDDGRERGHDQRVQLDGSHRHATNRQFQEEEHPHERPDVFRLRGRAERGERSVLKKQCSSRFAF